MDKFASKMAQDSIVGLSTIGPDLLFYILDFLRATDDDNIGSKKSIFELSSMGLCNRSFHDLLFKSCIFSEGKYSQFDALFGVHGKKYWKNIHQFKALISSKCNLSKRSRGKQPFKSLRILPPERELDSLGYYNSSLTQSQPEMPCSGYFGFEVLPEEVAVHGDWSGVSFLPSLSAFTSCAEPSGTMFCSYRLQVMAMLQEAGFLFLGFSNGDIDCIQVKSSFSRAMTGSGVQNYPYISGNTQQHLNEITCLSKVSKNHLVSSSMDSRILIHWNALVDGDLNRTSFMYFAVETILSIASCIGADNQVQLAVGSSDQSLHHSFWLKETEDNYFSYSAQTGDFVVRFDDATALGATDLVPVKEAGHVVHLSYYDEHLIIGTNRGNVVVMGKDVRYDESKYSIKNCCSGSVVESVKVYGGIMLIAGGASGEISFWDWDGGFPLSKWQVHPGRTIGSQTVFGCVVSMHFSHSRSSIIALCQDGYVGECRLSISSEKRVKEKTLNNKNARKKKHPKIS